MKDISYHHHDSQQVAHGGKEQAVQIVAHGDANLGAESIENDLPGDEEEDAKGDVAQGPPVLQRPNHKQDLHADVDEQLDGVEQIQDDEEPDGVGRTKPGPSLEGRQRDEEGDGKGNERAEPQHPHGERRAILVQLESDEAVDEQTRHDGAGQAVLHAGEVRERPAARGHDPGIDDERDEGEQHVQVEEAEDLLAPDGGELAPHVQDHDDGHAERGDVGKGRGALEDDCVGDLDVTGEAVGLDADAARGGQDGADGGA
ncbi:hypothetical protein Trco_008472 [Trichoderma cornu-damae]|uniref:Uncharacterized protein n=1 Tax=Trichoderma cornu-damae TaxID=654480 RepID=A0A9P8TT61_9HYPO|nr:hypothetical protein Trco_008472 [Trichoderma cornu-damae]